jgi:hypothetical protein
MNDSKGSSNAWPNDGGEVHEPSEGTGFGAWHAGPGGRKRPSER